MSLSLNDEQTALAASTKAGARPQEDGRSAQVVVVALQKLLSISGACFDRPVPLIAPGDPLERAPFDAAKDPLRLRVDQPCPCGTRKPLAMCCAIKGRLQTPPDVVLRAKRPVVRYRNPQCYAASDWTCDSKISREHAVSAAVLAVLSDAEIVEVSGHPWQRTERQSVSIKALASKILCTRHNSMLSALDTFVAHWFRELTGVRELLAAPDSAVARVRLINGRNLERWLLKVLCGLLRSYERDGVGGPKWSPPDDWLRLLRGARWPSGCGLYLEADPGAPWDAILSRPLIHRDRAIGLWMSIFGLKLRLIMEPKPPADYADEIPELTYHPIEIRWHRRQSYVSCLLGWHEPIVGPICHVTVSTPDDPEYANRTSTMDVLVHK